MRLFLEKNIAKNNENTSDSILKKITNAFFGLVKSNRKINLK